MTFVPFQPDVILATLQRHGVTFVLIGGLAAQLHGSPLTTRDVDITPEDTLENFERLSHALQELNARIRLEDVEENLPFAHDAESLRTVGVWNLQTDFGELDVSLVPSGTQGFSDFVGDSESVEVFGVTIRVAALADIIRSKQAANRPKDQRALPVLREILATRHRRSRD